MSSLPADFFAYVWAMQRIGARGRRGRRATFPSVFPTLQKRRPVEAFPHDSRRGSGSWQGCAWFTPEALKDSVDDNGYNALLRDTSLARVIDGPLADLESGKVSIAELLSEDRRDVALLEELFRYSPDDLLYRGPATTVWDKRKRQRQGHRDESVLWIGILPRDVIDLVEYRDLLSKDPLRLALLRRALRLFEPMPAESVRAAPWSQRAILRAFTEYYGGEITSKGDWDQSEVDFGSGLKRYAFWFPEKLTGKMFATLPQAAEVVWSDSRPLRRSLATLANAEQYRGTTPLHVFSEEMAASVWHDFPWLWHRPEGTGTISPASTADAEAQVKLMLAVSALHLLVGYRTTTPLVRAAAARWTSQPLDGAEQYLIARGLLDGEQPGLVPLNGPPISGAAMLQHDGCWAAVIDAFNWIWQEPSVENPAGALKHALDVISRALPDVQNDLRAQWRERFAGTREVLFDYLHEAMGAERYEEAADYVLQLSALGERDMLDVMWRSRFGSLRVDGSTETLLAVARAAVRSGRGISSAVDALLQRTDDSSVTDFLREIYPRLELNTFPQLNIQRALHLAAHEDTRPVTDTQG